MPTIEQLDPQPGDEVSIYLTSGGTISIVPTRNEVRATVVMVAPPVVGGSGSKCYCLAWKWANCPLSNNAAHRKLPAIGANYNVANDAHNYNWYVWYIGNWEAARIYPKQTVIGNAVNASQVPTLPALPAAKRTDIAELVLPTQAKEIRCSNRTCGKMNDCGAAKCWYCEGRL